VIYPLHHFMLKLAWLVPSCKIDVLGSLLHPLLVLVDLLD
jgi:hypothetical protein